MISYKWVELEEAIDAVDIQKKLAFDTETYNEVTKGFYGKISVAQFYQRDWEEVLLVRWPEPFRLAVFLETVTPIGHVIHYDFSTLQDQLGINWVPNDFIDTFYLARLFYPSKESFSLDSVLTYVLGTDIYLDAGLDKKELQKSNWGGLLTEEQGLYAALDVRYLFDVLDTTESMLEEFSYKLDILFTKYCLDFQQNGMPVLEDKLAEKWKANIDYIKKMDIPINVNSYQQVRPYIGEDESDALALARFELAGNDRAANVNKVRKVIKQNSFLTKFDKPVIYGKFLPSARSGRCTSKDQNLEQIPRALKCVFGSVEGEILTTADYAQLEMRGGCIITGETRMETLFRNNADLHSYTAEMLFGKVFTKKQRQIAKTCNFNLLYGGGHNMLGSILVKDAGILLSENELFKIRAKWLNLWPTIKAWQQSGISAWRNGQLWQTPLGRRYKGKMMTDQLNIKVQGFGAEVAKLATHYMLPRIQQMDADIKCRNFIHDNWIFSHDDDESLCRELSIIIADSMQESWFECSKSTKIHDLPMPVQVFSGYNWGDIEGGKSEYSYERL